MFLSLATHALVLLAVPSGVGPATVPAPEIAAAATPVAEASEAASAAQGPAGPEATAAPDPLDDDALPQSLAGADDVPDNSSDLSVDVDRWLLHDVLSEGIAQTPTWQAALDRGRTGPMLQTADGADDWQNNLRLARASAMLAGQPQQHHWVDERALRFDIPLAAHPLVDLYIDYFTGRGRWFFERWLNRGAQLIPVMQKILAAEGVPQDLVYLAMVESGFSARAYSSAAAVGYWQFIASTGDTYGLTRDRFVDERRDFVRATHGAARFLSDLHRHLGDWHLAWASYNAGEARIRRAMNKTGAQTFWQLISRPHGLAKETVHYVPKIIAAAIVAKDAARYGFTVTTPPPLQYDTMPVRGAVDLAVLAREGRCSVDALRQLNPSLLYDLTPPNRLSQLRVPTGTKPQLVAALQRLPPPKRVAYAAYRVRRGDSLYAIARRMNSSVETLRQFNKLGKGSLRPGTELVVPSFRLAAAQAPAPAKAKTTRLARRPAARKPAVVVASRSKVNRAPAVVRKLRRQKARAHHVVASGDTLWSIARRYNVPLEAVQGRRARASNRIAVGEIIDIF